MADIPELPDNDLEDMLDEDHTQWESEVIQFHIYKVLVAIERDLRAMCENSLNKHSKKIDGDE